MSIFRDGHGPNGPIREDSGLGDLEEKWREPLPGGGPTKTKVSQVRTRAEILGDASETTPTIELSRAIAKFVFNENLIAAELSPHIHPPFRGQSFDVISEAVLDFVGGSGSAAATQLQDILEGPGLTNEISDGATGTGISFGTPAAAAGAGVPVSNPSANVASFTVPRQHVAIVSRYGWDLPTVRAHQSVEVRLLAGSSPIGGQNQSAYQRGSVSSPAWCFAIVRGVGVNGTVIALQAQNLSTLVPYEVRARLSGWFWPVRNLMDQIESLLMRTNIKT